MQLAHLWVNNVLAISALRPGTRYTFAVTALDNAGNESGSSSPLTVQTATPKGSLTLTVRSTSRGDLVKRGRLIVGLRISRPLTIKLVARSGTRRLSKVVRFAFKTGGVKKVTLTLTPAARTWLRTKAGPVTITVAPVGLSSATWKTVSTKRTLRR